MVKNLPANAGDLNRHEFDPWVRKTPWRRPWQPTPVFLPGESHGQRGLAGYSPKGHKESDTTEAPEHARTHSILGREETNSAKFSKEIICIICHLSLSSPVRVPNKNIKTSTILSFYFSYTIYVHISYNYIMLYNYIMELGFSFFLVSVFQHSIFLTISYLSWEILNQNKREFGIEIQGGEKPL